MDRSHSQCHGYNVRFNGSYWKSCFHFLVCCFRSGRLKELYQASLVAKSRYKLVDECYFHPHGGLKYSLILWYLIPDNPSYNLGSSVWNVYFITSDILSSLPSSSCCCFFQVYCWYCPIQVVREPLLSLLFNDVLSLHFILSSDCRSLKRSVDVCDCLSIDQSFQCILESSHFLAK